VPSFRRRSLTISQIEAEIVSSNCEGAAKILTRTLTVAPPVSPVAPVTNNICMLMVYVSEWSFEA
jgi:hypothetical protein